MAAFDRYDDFEKEVDRLGVAAFGHLGTEDFTHHFLRLCDYFYNGYYPYICKKVPKILSLEKVRPVKDGGTTAADREKSLSANGQMLTEDTLTGIYCDILEKKDGEAAYISFLRNKIKAYSPEKAEGKDKPFFNFIFPDLKHKWEDILLKEKYISSNNGFSKQFSDNERDILRAVNKICDDFCKSGKDMPTDRELADILNAPRKGNAYSEKYVHELRKKAQVRTDSFDAVLENEDGEFVLSLADTVSTGFLNAKNAYGNFKGYAVLLNALNRIFDEHFDVEDKRRKAYPLYLSNDIMHSDVLSYMRDSMTLQEAIIEFGDVLCDDANEIMLTYPEEKYICIKRWVFEFFITNRRLLLLYELAASIGVGAPSFSKTIKATTEFIDQKLPSVLKGMGIERSITYNRCTKSS